MEKMKEETVLSICISTYNRASKIEKITKEILKCSSRKLNVVIVDDHSSDDTIIRLKNIVDSRLQIYKNTCNLGPKKNWYKTIEMGKGKYLLHFLDRDWIHFQYIERVISILENETSGFGYIGNMPSWPTMVMPEQKVVEHYVKGQEAMEMFAFNLIHPSGVIFKKKCWDSLENKKEFFYKDEYGIYPHSYVFSLLAQYETGIKIRYKMIEISSKDNFSRQKSRFYDCQKKKLPYWWTPEAYQFELQSLTKNFYKVSVANKSGLQKVLKYRFCENLYRATIAYNNIIMDKETIKHYNTKKIFLNIKDLLHINKEFVFDYIVFLYKNRRELVDICLLVMLIKEGMINAKRILEY